MFNILISSSLYKFSINIIYILIINYLGERNGGKSCGQLVFTYYLKPLKKVILLLNGTKFIKLLYVPLCHFVVRKNEFTTKNTKLLTKVH
jgi:hypothetical protein